MGESSVSVFYLFPRSFFLSSNPRMSLPTEGASQVKVTDWRHIHTVSEGARYDKDDGDEGLEEKKGETKNYPLTN